VGRINLLLGKKSPLIKKHKIKYSRRTYIKIFKEAIYMDKDYVFIHKHYQVIFSRPEKKTTNGSQAPFVVNFKVRIYPKFEDPMDRYEYRVQKEFDFLLNDLDVSFVIFEYFQTLISSSNFVFNEDPRNLTTILGTDQWQNFITSLRIFFETLIGSSKEEVDTVISIYGIFLRLENEF